FQVAEQPSGGGRLEQGGAVVEREAEVVAAARGEQREIALDPAFGQRDRLQLEPAKIEPCAGASQGEGSEAGRGPGRSLMERDHCLVKKVPKAVAFDPQAFGEQADGKVLVSESSGDRGAGPGHGFGKPWRACEVGA